MDMAMIIGLSLISQVVLTIDTVNNKVLFTKHPVRDNLGLDIIENDSELCIDSEVGQLMEIDLRESLCEDIQAEYRDRVEDMVKSYVPAQNVTTPIETKIVLSSEVPVFQGPRRLAPMEKKMVSAQVAEWLHDGIIRNSPARS